MSVKINRSIKRYKDLHRGERCVILGNGPSLDLVDLKAIDCPTIGTNANWMIYDATYHCATDDWQFQHYAERNDINKWTNLFTADVDYEAHDIQTPKSCVRLNVLDHEGEARWSDDLVAGIYICTTIMWYALQLARWMGFNEIGLIGFDLCGHNGLSKFSRHPRASEPFFEEAASTQNALMGWACKRIDGQARIINLSPISVCDTLERQMFNKWVRVAQR